MLFRSHMATRKVLKFVSGKSRGNSVSLPPCSTAGPTLPRSWVFILPALLFLSDLRAVWYDVPIEQKWAAGCKVQGTNPEPEFPPCLCPLISVSSIVFLRHWWHYGMCAIGLYLKIWIFYTLIIPFKPEWLLPWCVLTSQESQSPTAWSLPTLEVMMLAEALEFIEVLGRVSRTFLKTAPLFFIGFREACWSWRASIILGTKLRWEEHRFGW